MLFVSEVPVANARMGFSLVELVMVAWLLGVGLLGLAGVQVAALRMLGASRARQEALALAEDALAAAQGGGGAGTQRPLLEGPPGFALTLAWLPAPSGAPPGLHTVAAKVVWQEEAKGAPQTLVLTRFVADGGRP
jgi:type II secretory pathway pseudopilin PulG